MARLRSTASSQAPAKTAPADRQALKEKTNTARAKPPAHHYEDDGDTEGLVKEKQTRRGRPKKTVPESDELMMAGGLGLSDDAQQQPNELPMTTDELSKSDAVAPATSKPNRRPPRTARKVVQTEAQSKVMEGLKQRMEKTAQGQRAKKMPAPTPAAVVTSSSDTVTGKVSDVERSQAAVGERSEFSMSPSPPPAGKLSAVRGPRSSMAVPGSVLKAQATPAAHEASILALKNFKRRPRQPSMLQMVQQRTASARPSLANTAIENTAVNDSSVFDLGLSDDGEDDFAPEAEGTPLHAAKNKRFSSASTRLPASAESAITRIQPKAAPRKRKSDEANISTGSLSALKAKRRKPIEDDPQDDEEAPRSRREGTVPSSSERAETPQPAVTSDVQVINSPSTSTPPTDPPSSRYRTAKEDDFAVPSTEREELEELEEDNMEGDQDIGVNGTMADPLSSSPARPQAMATAEDLDDPLLADPLSQFTQESEVVEKPKPKKKSKPVFTSTLQSLLPKRRQPLRSRGRKSEYDMDSGSDEDDPHDVSHLEDDEDELGATRRRTKTVPAKTPKRAGGKKGRPSKAAATTARKPAAPPKRTASIIPGAKRTYGRAATSDKENEGYESTDEPEESTLPDVSLSLAEVAQGKELEQAKNKFAEVDDWDMEFESMSQEFHRSSSQEWR